jgi:hypothetical protein
MAYAAALFGDACLRGLNGAPLALLPLCARCCGHLWGLAAAGPGKALGHSCASSCPPAGTRLMEQQ